MQERREKVMIGDTSDDDREVWIRCIGADRLKLVDARVVVRINLFVLVNIQSVKPK